MKREERARTGGRKPGTLGTLGTVGERPEGPFGGVPVAELAILVGIIGVIFGVAKGSGPALPIGAGVCGLGVLELTAREHFSGFRSHTTLLAAVPALIVEIVLVLAVGAPKNHVLIVIPIAPVFAVAFWLLRKRFLVARQRRTVRGF